MDRKTTSIVIAGGIAAITLYKLTGDQLTAKVALGQLVIILTSTGIGYTIGWFVSPKAREFRHIVKIIALLGALLVGLGNYGILGFGITYTLSFIGFLLALIVSAGGAMQSIMRRPTTFGSAEWASLPYLQEHGLIGESGIRLGEYVTSDAVNKLHYPGDRHLLTVAPTRSGKGTTLIVNNLLTYEGSVLVVDPKGENALITFQQRKNLGQEVFIVDPWQIGPGEAARFNPLDWLVPGDPDIGENAMLLADSIVMAEDSGDKFWIEEPKALLQGLILYVATDPGEAENRHLPRVRDLLLLDGDDLKLLFQRMVDSDHHIVASTGARCLQKEDRLLANVIATAQAQTHFLDSEKLRHSLSASDFRFEQLKEGKTSIYLLLPADRLNAFSRWLRLLIQQAVTVSARDVANRPDKPVLFILDEMPALGRLTMVEQAFGLMAGFGMQLWGIVQDLGQLKKIYGDGGYESLISNSGCITYFGSRDRLTAEYFSALCGVTTVWNFSTAISRAFSMSSGQGGGSSSSSSSTTDTSSATQRHLAYADELMRLPEDRSLILIENRHPIIGTKVKWFDDDKLRTLGRNLRLEGPAA